MIKFDEIEHVIMIFDKRVATFADLIQNALGLHDIGKTVLPDE